MYELKMFDSLARHLVVTTPTFSNDSAVKKRCVKICRNSKTDTFEYQEKTYMLYRWKELLSL